MAPKVEKILNKLKRTRLVSRKAVNACHWEKNMQEEFWTASVHGVVLAMHQMA